MKDLLARAVDAGLVGREVTVERYHNSDGVWGVIFDGTVVEMSKAEMLQLGIDLINASQGRL